MIRAKVGLVFTLVAIGLAASGSSAEARSELDTCFKSTDLNQKLAACTKVIATIDDARAKSAALLHRALTHNLQSNRKQALADIEAALQLKPGNQNYLLMKGRILSDMGEHGSAIAIFDRLLEARPGDAGVLRSKVEALSGLKKHGAAIALSGELIARNPADYFAWITRGKALKAAGELGKALWSAWHAVNLDVELAHAHKLRGDVYIELGRLSDAQEAFEEAKRYHRAKGHDPFADSMQKLQQALAAETKQAGETKLQEGRSAFGDKDYPTALTAFLAAAQAGNGSAMGNAGYMYATGLGTEADEERAVHWYRMAAENGSAEAMNNLATMLEDGRGVARDPAGASLWRHRSAEQGYPIAMRQLGMAYETGEGIAEDLYLAAGYYRAATQHKDTTSLYRLGRMYEDGRGVPQDSVKAAGLVAEAVNQQDADVLGRLTREPQLWRPAFWREMQAMMRDIGLYKGKLNGEAGPETLKALKALAGDDY